MRKLSDREGAQACRVVEQAAEDDDGGCDDGGDDGRESCERWRS